MRKDNENRSMMAVSEVFDGMGILNELDNSQFTYFDINVTGKTGIVGKVEVKYRYINKDIFIDYWMNKGLILEEKKYLSLKLYNAVYLNYLVINNVELIVAWSLTGKSDCTTHISTIKTDINANKTTEFYNNSTVNKSVYLLKDKSSVLRMVKYKDKWYKLTLEQFNNYIINKL